MIDVNHLFFNHADSTDQNEFSLKQMIPIIDSYARINNQSCFVIDFDEHKLLYSTEQFVYIDEATIKDVKRDCAIPYWSIISDETLEKLLDIRKNYLLVDDDFSIEEYAKHICTIDYPILLRNHEMFITQKFTPIVMRSDGITKVGLFTINYSTRKKMESIIITPSGKRYRFDFNERKYVKYNLDVTLSLVEKAILHRARKGMTNEEIAQSLFISVSTVKTHRMRIFKKLHVETITEALAVVSNYQLL